MNTESIRPGRIFVSYAREDRERVRLLVDYLTHKGFETFWDEDIEPGSPFRRVLEDVLEEAACVIVAWTKTSVQSEFVRSEAARGNRRGALLPVKLDADAQIPLGLDEVQHLDLHDWDGSETAAVDKLADEVGKRVQRGASRMSYHGTLRESSAVGRSLHATDELLNLASRVSSLGDALIENSGPATDLRRTLDEIGKTYTAVRSAIGRFVAPGLQRGAMDVAPYIEMERGALVTDIENGRGHCSRIQTYYFRHGGLRDSVKPGIDPQLLNDLDKTFAHLSTADSDLFEELTEIGHVLTNESRVIANLLAAEEDSAARRRILDARQALAPLEDRLAAAIQSLQRAQSSLGYAGRSNATGPQVSQAAPS